MSLKVDSANYLFIFNNINLKNFHRNDTFLGGDTFIWDT